jgi:hypothetical protein
VTTPELPVSLRPGGLDETVLDPEPDEAVAAVAAALAAPAAARQGALRDVASRWPACLEAWARLGDAADDDVTAYACYRVAYHRGLDRLRRAGWRGSGYVRWAQAENRGFLRGLVGLGRAAAALGESDEAARVTAFRRQLDPDWDGAADPGPK